MSVEVTRAYLRGRLIVILVGFVLAVGVGAGIMLWQAEKAKNSVKYGAVIAAMAESTSDVLYYSARIEQSSYRDQLTKLRAAAAREALSLQAMTGANAAEPTAAPKADDDAQVELRKQHHVALERLQAAYNTFERAVSGDVGMLESARITVEEEAKAKGVIEAIKGTAIPDPVLRLWIGGGEDGQEDGQGYALRNDIRDVISLANRLDIFEDYSAPAARRVFEQLSTLANSRIRPNLAVALDRLNKRGIAGYEQLKLTLAGVAVMIVVTGGLFGALVFVPMMRNISNAHGTLREANASIDEARLRAESADRAKSEFLANMSHEIRTPMNGVLGMAELLSKTQLDMRQKMFTDVIMKSGHALLTIINDILDFSKIDAGQLELHPAPFRLAEAIEDVATLVSSKVAEKDLELIVRIDPSLPPFLVGDVGRIRQVVTNLIGNGVKFTERGHVLVDVSGKVRDGTASVTIRVEDTGIGIPADKLQSVFEKFAQVDSSSTRRHEGTGLGLAITSRLVQLMGGRMGVESEVGRGSTFWFEVPLPVHAASTPDKPVPLDVSGARILVIDDNSVNRAILIEQLRSWGFDCAAAESGPVGLAFLKKAAEIGAIVDCVILDYQMPEMNGAQVAAAIRDDGSIASAPVVLLTSVDQADFGKLLVEHKIAAYLAKPARSSALLETLVTVLQRTMTGKTPRHRVAAEAPAVPPPAPVAPVLAQPEPRMTAPVARFPAQQLDILVVEDNEVNQLVFGQILDGLGVAYRIAGNGRTGVEMQRTLKPRLILMDVSMPEMSGFEATRAIRAAEMGTGIHTPIIGVTAHALKGDREKCIESGMDDYISKPVSPDTLAAKIASWLPERRAALIA